MQETVDCKKEIKECFFFKFVTPVYIVEVMGPNVVLRQNFIA